MLIRLENITKTYELAKQEVTVLNNVSLNIWRVILLVLWGEVVLESRLWLI